MDLIEIKDQNGQKKKMEVVTIFGLENKVEKYIIYRELDASHYYVAKFKNNENDLDTNLSKEEYELCNKIFKEVVPCN